MQIAGTEVFGPVLSVLKTGSEDEAINIANSTEYGLVGGIFTDIDAAHRAARRIRAGQIFINEWYAKWWKPLRRLCKSGYGREKGREALNYVQTKNIAYRTAGETRPDPRREQRELQRLHRPIQTAWSRLLVCGCFARIGMGEDGQPVAVQRQECGHRRKHTCGNASWMLKSAGLRACDASGHK